MLELMYTYELLLQLLVYKFSIKESFYIDVCENLYKRYIKLLLIKFRNCYLVYLSWLKYLIIFFYIQKTMEIVEFLDKNAIFASLNLKE